MSSTSTFLLEGPVPSRPWSGGSRTLQTDFFGVHLDMIASNTLERTITLRIRRQDSPDAPGRWEEFAVPHRPNMNIISCLQHIAAHPRTTDGTQTTPVVYDAGCLEEVCGACTMVINGKVRQSC